MYFLQFGLYKLTMVTKKAHYYNELIVLSLILHLSE